MCPTHRTYTHEHGASLFQAKVFTHPNVHKSPSNTSQCHRLRPPNVAQTASRAWHDHPHGATLHQTIMKSGASLIHGGHPKKTFISSQLAGDMNWHVLGPNNAVPHHVFNYAPRQRWPLDSCFKAILFLRWPEYIFSLFVLFNKSVL